MKPKAWRAVVSGFIGTIVFTLMMHFVAPVMTGQKMDIAAKLGEMTHTGLAGGIFIHFFNGAVIFPLIYVFLLYQFLPGSPWQKGLLWGVILWLGVELVMVPMMGGGVFSTRMGGPKVVAAALIGHLVYGAIFGVITGGPELETAAKAPTETLKTRT